MPALKPPPQQPHKSLYVESAGTTATSMQWFVSSTQAPINGIRPYVPRKGFIAPLINGEEAFGAVEKAIKTAIQSIDYVTWGFDPSMRLSDGGKAIGELLLEAADSGVKVRLLLWYAGHWASLMYGKSDSGRTTRHQEPSLWDKLFGSSDPSKPPRYEEHSTANLPGYDGSRGEASKYITSANWFKAIQNHKNIELCTRAMDGADLGDAIQKNQSSAPPSLVQDIGQKHFATHHQKMVLVDYALPNKAKGFVLGSNTLPRYWDTSEHPLEHNNRRMDYIDTVTDTNFDRKVRHTRTPATVKFGPWQDISAAVGGAVLFDLHANFASAWQRAGGSKLEATRNAVTPEVLAKVQGKCNAAMQVVRTQPQESDHSIKDVYFQNVRNARQYIYFENQYFRLPELTQELDKAAGKLSAWGRKDNLYVFVVTNTPDDHGRLNTYKMLGALGKADQMPKLHAHTQDDPKKAIQPLPSTKRDVAGLKSVICTLTACEGSSPKDLRYAPIYVHSKLVAIDDHFFTLGSANLNNRSMVSDSELNVAVPHDTLTKDLRTTLWGMHRGQSLEDDFEKEFAKWNKVASKNWESMDTKKVLTGRITQFNDDGTVVHIAYD